MIGILRHNYRFWVFFCIGLVGILASYTLVWKNQTSGTINFIDGDPEFYYYYLQAVFNQNSLPDYEWLKPGSINTITHHPAGLAVLLLPFYLAATLAALLFDFNTNGLSLPYQISISAAGIAYAMLGLHFLWKLLTLQGIGERVSIGIVVLVFAGSTLFQYAVVEPAMSHVYSFAAISAFLYFTARYVQTNIIHTLLHAAIALGMVLLIRPNNILILMFVPFFFESGSHFIGRFKSLIKQKVFYFSIVIVLMFVVFQLLVWMKYEKTLFSDRYAAYGFDWLHPHLTEVLFGFEAGLFIYAPLTFLFLFGLIPLAKDHTYRFFIAFGFLAFLIYFFSAYSAYTYFDGLGIRVLVDYYPVFALVGAKLFAYLSTKTLLIYPVGGIALFFIVVNLVYSIQSSSGILQRAGMTFEKWKYVFLRTSNNYKNSLGGMNDYPPYAAKPPVAFASGTLALDEAYDFSGKEYGLGLSFDSLAINSNRIFIRMNCTRRESTLNSSQSALVCIALEDGNTRDVKSYVQFKLNETPSNYCCKSKTYHYGINFQADLQAGDHLKVYIWNREKSNFLIEAFSAEVFNYNYQIATP